MRIDELDLDIFLLLAYNFDKMFTVVDIVKELLAPKNRDELIKQTSKLDYRLKKWVDINFIDCIIRGGVKQYTTNIQEVFLEENTLLQLKDDVVDSGKALILKFCDDTYFIYFPHDDNPLINGKSV